MKTKLKTRRLQNRYKIQSKNRYKTKKGKLKKRQTNKTSHHLENNTDVKPFVNLIAVQRTKMP